MTASIIIKPEPAPITVLATPIGYYSIYHSGSPMQCWKDISTFGLQNHINWGYITSGPHTSAYFEFDMKHTPEAKAAFGAFLTTFNKSMTYHVLETQEHLNYMHMTEYIEFGTPGIPQPIVDRLSIGGTYCDINDISKLIKAPTKAVARPYDPIPSEYNTQCLKNFGFSMCKAQTEAPHFGRRLFVCGFL